MGVPPLDRLVVFDDPTPGDGPWNMALDQALLEAATSPTLRAYRWSQPFLSIGYFQRLSTIENPLGLPVVRRWTGGGTVPHGDDWTFSLIVPKPHPFGALAPPETYCAIHRAVAEALSVSGFPNLSLSVSTPADDSTTPASPLACFVSPVRDDVMRGGQKIAGGAQRRSKHGLLHQGSIQNIDPPASFLAELATHLARSHSARPALTETEKSRAGELVQSRYATPGWLRKR